MAVGAVVVMAVAAEAEAAGMAEAVENHRPVTTVTDAADRPQPASPPEQGLYRVHN